MAEPTKRKNFTEEEDVMLLKQTLADELYQQEHGKVMEYWEKLAQTLVACADFSRKNLTAKRPRTALTRLSADKDAANESAGEAIRRLAVERLKRSREDDAVNVSESPSRANKFAKLAEILQAQKEQEFVMRREQWEQERQDRRDIEKRFILLLEHLANKK
ncbi:hypothetical protein PHYSODRAFT_309926 [Phytophthora sojae]|uniref:Uncharacterized protein n=1 Tax=Phytophthora sojae (strain P6497) TaxID=1094619 RepID=G4YJA5_PHYSP|nr:hypothetical protein PHYSODRAFT_309926 [Phytophthora sojae]EGZ29702.1 hypothetical protein PHYSODRAFT_309926 [Phytophthora sojae]|eukprot:XP_009516977.1 hypothetical protein PHYSODRAFT_309926 [Phytophthora sojae]